MTGSRVSCVRRSACGSQQGRQPVHRDHNLIGDRPGRDTTWPSRYRWNAKTAFEQLALHAGEWPSIRKPLAAIVAGEDHDRLACKSSRIERLEHPADIRIQALHHGGVCPLRAAVAVREPAGPDSPRLGLVIGALPWPMRRREMEAQQKRLSRLGIAFDGLHRPIAKQVRHVTVTLDRYLLLVELARQAGEHRVVHPGRIRTMIEIVGTASEYSKETVVAALQGTEIWQVTEMPFTDQGGAIARFLQ
jgi:hypothetical protein